MSNFFIPILESNEEGRESKLFSISSKLGDLTRINGFNPRPLIKIIELFFSPAKIDFSLLDSNLNPFENFSGNTDSISLGVFCSAYALINNRQLKTKYDSITVTGDFDCEDKELFLSNVIFIEEKFSALKDYAINHINERKIHLFVYVADKEIIPEGMHENNILVIRFTNESRVEELFAEIFEPDFTIEQKICIEEVYQDTINDYVQTSSFIKWKKEIVQKNCGGLVLVGESNTGKSIAAKALCEYLIEAGIVDYPVWLTVNDNKEFLDALRHDNNELLEDFVGEESGKMTIKAIFPEQFKFLDTALKNGNKVCLVIDNIEYDYCDEIFDYLIKEFSEISEQLKFVLTSWYKPHSISKEKKLRIIDKEISDTKLSKFEFFSIVESVARKAKYNSKLNESNQKFELLDILYSQVPNNPGFIPIALSILLESSVDELIKRFASENIKDMNPKVRILKIAFSVLNVFSQIVLFASFAFKSKNTQNEEGFVRIFNKDKICWLIQDKLFKSTLQKKVFFTSQNIERALSELQESNFISRNRNKCILKKDIIEYCVFSKSETNEISVELENIRNTLVGLYSKVRWSIFLQNYEKFEEYISQVKDIDRKFDFLLESCESNCDIRFIRNIIDSGVDVNHVLEENGTSRVIWKTAYTSSHLDILKFFMEKGAKVSPEDEEGICILTCVNANYEMFDFVFSNYCNKNINQKFSNYENNLILLNNYNYLHLVTVLNSNVEIFKKIIQLGADYRIKGGDNNSTILHFAAVDKKSIEILEYILENKLFEDFYEKTSKGFTALDLARRRNNQKAIELLEKYEKNL